MLKVKKALIEQYNLKKKGYDFMGYILEEDDIFTLHHLIIPARKDGKSSIDNTAILCGKTSHPYIHLVEKKEKRIFYLITLEIVKMKEKGHLDLTNLKNIHYLLCEFEDKHIEDENELGEPIIKPEYKIRLLRK